MINKYVMVDLFFGMIVERFMSKIGCRRQTLGDVEWSEEMIELLTLSNIEEFERITAQELILIAFGIPWSSPCQNQHKILLDLMKRYSGSMAIARVDVEKFPEIARKSNIQTVPTLIVYREGRELKRLVGLQSLQSLHTFISATKISNVPGNSTGGAGSRVLYLPNC